MVENFHDILDAKIQAHQGWASLEKFGELISQRALDAHGLRIFLASTAHFFCEIPGGILALALRVTDDRIDKDRFGAVSDGAKILLAGVDEYGLGGSNAGDGRTHHEYFADMVDDLGLTEADICNDDYIIPEARALAKLTRISYRSSDIPASVGFHFASEKTSDREFNLCFEGLSRFAADYANSSTAVSPATLFAFYYMHTVVEPAHGSASAQAVDQYASTPVAQTEIFQGAEEFMQAYGYFWEGLRAALVN